MRAGSLKHKIEFISMKSGRDDYGSPTQIPESFEMAWSNIIPISGSEKYMSNQRYSESTHKIKCRYIPGIDTKMSIKYGDRTFDIISVINVGERSKELEIIAKEIL
ncbi:phage head closure protein [Arcobacter sp.]|uniref:phage head closure protein n=1 Tax=unclassified Arcobacter TaxID=2593671 RepID=UPI003B0008B9